MITLSEFMLTSKLTFFRMAFQESARSHSSRRRWHHSLRARQRSAHSYCALLRRVSAPLFPICRILNVADHHSQPFWGRVVASSGAGPAPIAYRELTVDKLLHAIQVCRSTEAKIAAEDIASRMRQENGVETAVRSFHRRLPRSELSCDVLPQHAARWIYMPKKSKHASIKLSNEALSVLLDSKDVDQSRVHP